MPILGSLYIENLILVAGIAGMSTDLLLIELDKEGEEEDDGYTSSLELAVGISVLLSENSTMEDERIAIKLKKYSLNLNLI